MDKKIENALRTLGEELPKCSVDDLAQIRESIDLINDNITECWYDRAVRDIAAAKTA